MCIRDRCIRGADKKFSPLVTEVRTGIVYQSVKVVKGYTSQFFLCFVLCRAVTKCVAFFKKVKTVHKNFANEFCVSNTFVERTFGSRLELSYMKLWLDGSQPLDMVTDPSSR